MSYSPSMCSISPRAEPPKQLRFGNTIADCRSWGPRCWASVAIMRRPIGHGRRPLEVCLILSYRTGSPDWEKQLETVIIDKDGVIRYRRTYSAPNLPDLEEIMREVQKLEAPAPKA